MKPEHKTFLLAVGISTIGLIWSINAISGGQLLRPIRALYLKSWRTPVLGTEAVQSSQNYIHVIPDILNAFENNEIPESDTTAASTSAPGGGTTSGPIGNSGPLPTGTVTADEVIDVQGIQVHKSIAGQVNLMLTAAKNAGANLSGSGWRDPQEQIFLRKQNCGTSDYDIYQRPSGQCSPPTAIPGTSNHERGLAIDFYCDNTGDTVRTGDVCFNWLTSNAGTYGFFNLPSESWHWSVDGH